MLVVDGLAEVGARVAVSNGGSIVDGIHQVVGRGGVGITGERRANVDEETRWLCAV